MKQTVLILMWLTLSLSVFAQSFTAADRQQIREAIEQQMKDYPASTLKDVYKNFFQDAFGPGHLMSSAADAEERMANYLRSECEEAKSDVDPSPYYVKTGWHGRFYRVNLSVINDGRISFDMFMQAFMESARSFTLPTIEEWRREWKEIESVLKESGYSDVPDYKADSQAIEVLLNEGRYASHHSVAYNKAYHPHYRLIEKAIFEQQLLPEINKTNPGSLDCDSLSLDSDKEIIIKER